MKIHKNKCCSNAFRSQILLYFSDDVKMVLDFNYIEHDA